MKGEVAITISPWIGTPDKKKIWIESADLKKQVVVSVKAQLLFLSKIMEAG